MTKEEALSRTIYRVVQSAVNAGKPIEDIVTALRRISPREHRLFDDEVPMDFICLCLTRVLRSRGETIADVWFPSETFID